MLSTLLSTVVASTRAFVLRGFVNYVATPSRSTAFNLGVARVLLGVYMIWKLASYEFERLQLFPAFLFQASDFGIFLPDVRWLAWLPAQRDLTFLLLIAVIVGWRVPWTAFLSALLIAHMAALATAVTNATTTFLVGIYALLLFAVYRFDDPLTLDARRDGRAEVVPSKPVALPVLRWLQVIVAMTYFFTGYWKLHGAGLDWASAENLTRTMHLEAIMHLRDIPPIVQLMIDYPVFARISAVATLVLELGFLPALLLRWPITPFIVGLIGLHTLVWLSMDILFFDQYLLFLVFVPWDRLAQRLLPQAWLRRLATAWPPLEPLLHSGSTTDSSSPGASSPGASPDAREPA